MEEAQPQTIEAEDGFPLGNMKFCGRAQEIMAIIQKNKPASFTQFDQTHVNNIWLGRMIEKAIGYQCRKYTYEEVYDASKSVNLVYLPREGANVFFLKENMKDAYILYQLWEGNEQYGMENTEETGKIQNTIIGILLGYKKKDIRAWFVMRLEEEFNMNFDNKKQRAEFIQKPEFKKRRDEIAAEFETIYEKANKELDRIRKEETVPESWSSQLKTLDPPKKSLLKRILGKDGGYTKRRKLGNHKTLRRRK